MGLFNQIASALGGNNEAIQRFMSGSADLNDPNSKDRGILGQMVQNASKEDLDAIFSETAKQLDQGEYREHIKPGQGQSSPLSSLGQGGLATVASTILSALMGQGGFNIGQLTQMIPGLHSTDPDKMNASEVASLAAWTRQNRPEAFGHAAADIGKKDPGLLQQLLGNRALMTAAAKLAQKYIS